MFQRAFDAQRTSLTSPRLNSDHYLNLKKKQKKPTTTTTRSTTTTTTTAMVEEKEKQGRVYCLYRLFI